MPYYLGPVYVDDSINVPTAVFPHSLTEARGTTNTTSPQIATHVFGYGDGRVEQRYYLGPGKQVFTINLTPLSTRRRNDLINFWNELGGPLQAFYYDFQKTSQNGTARFTCIFE